MLPNLALRSVVCAKCEFSISGSTRLGVVGLELFAHMLRPWSEPFLVGEAVAPGAIVDERFEPALKLGAGPFAVIAPISAEPLGALAAEVSPALPNECHRPSALARAADAIEASDDRSATFAKLRAVADESGAPPAGLNECHRPSAFTEL
ncbi:MAG TPA: hypothetical protein VEV41_24140 [Terriglobales bacterium]|nr:hypothetical protein [Terriglobales bacterium]